MVIARIAQSAIVALAAFVFGSLSHAEGPRVLPCTNERRPGAPICGDDSAAKPIILEPIFVDDFEDGLRWRKSGNVSRRQGEPKHGAFSVRLGNQSSITTTIPLINRSTPLIVFQIAARDLSPGGQAVAEYFNGLGWRPLLQITAGEMGVETFTEHIFFLTQVANVPDFKLRFQVRNSDRGYAYIDEVSVFTPRFSPPP